MAGRFAVFAGAAVPAVLAAALAGCGSPAGPEGAPTAAPERTPRPEGTLTVFAATSLTGAFDQIARDFEHAHPGVTVKLNYGGSSTLATQLTQGAPADVFASAAPANMKTVTDHDLAAGTPDTFARNTGEIMVPHDNPKHITSVADLARNGTKVVTCAEKVPCGALAQSIFRNAGVTVHPVSQEQNVGGVVTKVSMGEADAGIVYVTDVKASNGKAAGVPIPASHNAITDYPITALRGTHNAATATAFIHYVLGSDGQRVLKRDGFLPASS